MSHKKKSSASADTGVNLVACHREIPKTNQVVAGS